MTWIDAESFDDESLDDEGLGDDESPKPYKTCCRCGLRPVRDDGNRCDYCKEETAYTAGRLSAQDLSRRRCPICRGRMRSSHDYSRTMRLVCDCGASYDIARAALSYPGCTRTGKNQLGTNMIVRGEARKAQKREQGERLAAEEPARRRQAELQRRKRVFEAQAEDLLRGFRQHGRIPDSPPVVLAFALIMSSDDTLRRRLFESLYAGGHALELEIVAKSKSRYRQLAKAAALKLRSQGPACTPDGQEAQTGAADA